MYQAANPKDFYSSEISGAQRLPNGNTLVCAMTEGHIFEVTAGGDGVWEYINPVTRDGAVTTLPDGLPMSNAVFRAYRYGSDHPALKGRDLSPKGTIVERAAQGLDVRPKGNRPADAASRPPALAPDDRPPPDRRGQGERQIPDPPAP